MAQWKVLVLYAQGHGFNSVPSTDNRKQKYSLGKDSVRVQQVKALPSKAGDLHLILSIHMEAGENSLLPIVL